MLLLDNSKYMAEEALATYSLTNAKGLYNFHQSVLEAIDDVAQFRCTHKMKRELADESKDGEMPPALDDVETNRPQAPTNKSGKQMGPKPSRDPKRQETARILKDKI